MEDYAFYFVWRPPYSKLLAAVAHRGSSKPEKYVNVHTEKKPRYRFTLAAPIGWKMVDFELTMVDDKAE